MARDQSRDGYANRIRYMLLTSGRRLWGISNRTAWLHTRVNRFFVNNAIGLAEGRLNPLSAMADYTSLDSLRDKTWFGRHLPSVTPAADLPEPEAVAELFRRKGNGVTSPKSTMLFACFAQWFTDGFLLTDPNDRRKTHSNHELDLSQLYGLHTEVTNALRLKSEVVGRRGRLKSQSIDGEEYAPFLFDSGGKKKAEFAALPAPLMMMPSWPSERRKTLFAFGGERANTTPQTAMINTLMLREHNRICGLLERDNPDWDDERVFQTARNITIVIQLRIVIEEYINHISPYCHDAKLDPSVSWKADWNRPIWFAIEFNLLYRWHSLIPNTVQWAGQTYAGENWLLDNRPLLQVGLKRAFEATSSQPAGEIQLGNTPEFLMPAEIASIRQGRQNRLGSYNDYREAFGYPRVTRFEQISSSPETVAALRRLYGTPDRLEFYVGLFAEDARPDAAVPALIGRMVALDAFSQALLSPLLAKRVYNAQTFSATGMQIIQETRSLEDLLRRNAPDAQQVCISMTRPEAKPKPGIAAPRVDSPAGATHSGHSASKGRPVRTPQEPQPSAEVS